MKKQKQKQNKVKEKAFYSPPKKILEAVENYQEQQKEKKEEKPKRQLNDGLKVWNQFIEQKRKENNMSLSDALKMYGKNGSKHKEYQKFKQQK